MSIERYKVGPRLAAAAKHADTIYVAGTVADDTKLDAKGQTEQILHKIDDALKHFGSHKSKIVWANVWVSDIRHYDGMNAAWDAWVEKGSTPARATVEARLATPGYLVEIAVVAAA
jgi:enamine deaminase RidA (YjgF/YER057c/UK114 family)